MEKTRIIILLAFVACTFMVNAQQKIPQFLKKNNIKTQKTDYGLFYTIEEAGKQRAPKKGDYVKVNYKGQLLDGTVFDETKKGQPFIFQVGYRQVIRGMDVGITLFKTGGSGTIYVPAELGYGKNGVGKTVPANADLMFDIELLDVMDAQEYDKYMVTLENKERAAFKQHVKTQYTKDLKLINEYAITNKIKTKRTPSGLSYAITKKGKGSLAAVGDLMKVSYEGYLLDGTTFDKSQAKKSYEFEIGTGKVIAGWDEGLANFNKGAEGWLLVPSSLAYGPRAIEEDKISIPSDAVLIFKIKVLDIRQQNNAQTRK